MNIVEEEKLLQLSVNQKKIDLIKEMVATYYNQPMSDFTRRGRKKEVVNLRYVAMWLISKLTTVTLMEIGKSFSKDHATVIHGCKQIDKYMTLHTEKLLQREVSEIKALTEMRIAAIDGNVNLTETHHYINLNSCTGVKVGENKAIVFSGFYSEEIERIFSALNVAGVIVKHIHEVENPTMFENTGMHLIKRK